LKILLARHGNTFGPDDKVVWAGARTDLPLVAFGHQQAERLGQAIAAMGVQLDHIYAGPLLRTKETASGIAAVLGLDPDRVSIVDTLREIDYGLWEGRSNDEIKAEYGSTEIDDWQKRSIWPQDYGWSPDEAGILANWDALVQRITTEGDNESASLVVSSNGIFRIVAKGLGLAAEDAKMGTGCLSQLSVSNGKFSIDFWNRAPK
jgi:broad specificity phosphatase PhoE